MKALCHVRPLKIVLLIALVAASVRGAPALAADVTTPFTGKAVNGGTVTHEDRDGRHVLRARTTSRSRARPIRTGR